MRTNGTVIIIAMIHWHFTWQSQHNMASGLVKSGYRVIFVEPLPKRWPRISEFGRVWGRLTGNSKAAGFCEQALVPGVELVSPRLLPDAGPLTRPINRRLFVPGLAARLRQDVQLPLIVINYLPTAASLALMYDLRPDATIYHCVNDWANDPFTPAAATEAELAAAVDMVWADSPVNFARTSQLRPDTIHLPHGVNVDLFAGARREPPAPPPARPLCAFFGALGISADVELLRAVSHRYPLRLIGPIRASLEGFAVETEIVGAVPHERVPELLRDVDVLLLPYAHSEHNKGIMPAKMFECLATGKPTVACGLVTLYDYADLFFIRETHEAFLDAIAEAVHEPAERQGPRFACAESHSYQRRMKKIEGYLDELLAGSREVPVAPRTP